MRQTDPDDKANLLRRHRLSHVADLKMSEDFLDRRFASGCSMANCNAACCRYGVMVDILEKERILAHADLVRKHMEPHQEHDEALWFEEEEFDKDFPSGKAIGTQHRDYGCVFLDSRGRCVLQKAATEEGMEKFALKPFFCVAYPVTIENGHLEIDEPGFTSDRTGCCATVDEGDLTILDVCGEELRFVLGKDGFDELRLKARGEHDFK